MDWDFALEDEQGCLDLLADAGFILVDSNKKKNYLQSIQPEIQVATLHIVLVKNYLIRIT